jgi:hypothetical protein
MTMYLPNDDIRPTGGEAAEFLDAPAPLPALTPTPGAFDEAVEFLHELVEENAAISGDIVQLEENLWAIHGFFSIDGDVLMAEFDSYEAAAIALEQLRRDTI